MVKEPFYFWFSGTIMLGKVFERETIQTERSRRRNNVMLSSVSKPDYTIGYTFYAFFLQSHQ